MSRQGYLCIDLHCINFSKIS